MSYHRVAGYGQEILPEDQQAAWDAAIDWDAATRAATLSPAQQAALAAQEVLDIQAAQAAAPVGHRAPATTAGGTLLTPTQLAMLQFAANTPEMRNAVTASQIAQTLQMTEVSPLKMVITLPGGMINVSPMAIPGSVPTTPEGKTPTPGATGTTQAKVYSAFVSWCGLQGGTIGPASGPFMTTCRKTNGEEFGCTSDGKVAPNTAAGVAGIAATPALPAAGGGGTTTALMVGGAALLAVLLLKGS